MPFKKPVDMGGDKAVEEKRSETYDEHDQCKYSVKNIKEKYLLAFEQYNRKLERYKSELLDIFIQDFISQH